MALFGKKPQTTPPVAEEYPQYAAQAGNPVKERIDQMRQQGYSDNQIITFLQNEGVDINQIYEAISQPAGPTGGPQIGQPSWVQEPVPPQAGAPQSGFGPEIGAPAGPPRGTTAQGAPKEVGAEEREKIEAMAETIIDEKWHELLKTITKINEWKEATENRITKLEQQMKDLQASFDNLHTAIIGKIGEYDQNIINVGTEIKAMEKVFQKILPTFSENVNELSRIVNKIKK